MTWLTLRQFRAQAVTALGALLVLAVTYGYTGPHLAHLYDASALARCGHRPGCASLAVAFISEVKADQVYPALFFAGMAILLVLPAIIGAFWGAPLVARELEAGTYRLAWTQDVTRTRWIAVKLGLLGLAAATTSGLLSALFTWWSGPINSAGGFPDNLSQFTRIAPPMFQAQGIAPAAWAAVAFALGVLAGIVVRRTIAAMAVTVVVVVLLQVLWPAYVRPHLRAPERATAPVTTRSLESMIVSHSGAVSVAINQPGTPYLPGAWVVSNSSLTPAGRVFVLPDVPVCASGGQQQCATWIAGHHLTQVVEYQPASSFWVLQWTETLLLLVLAAGLGGVATWRVRQVLT